MARERLRPPPLGTVDVYEFAAPQVVEFQEKVHAKGMPKPSRDDVMNAAVWSCSSLPAEVCKAMVEAYIAAEKRHHDQLTAALEAFFRA